MNLKRNFLVTGGSGFVGQALVSALTMKKNVMVYAVTNTTNKISLPKAENLVWITANLAEDHYTLPKDLDIVFHLAGDSSLGNNAKELGKLKESNELLSKKLTQYLKLSDLKQFIYVSSISACEQCDDVLVSEDNGYPISEYGFSKLRTENIIKEELTGHCPITIFRPTALFGESHLGSIFELTNRINKGQFVIFGDGHNYTNFYYIKEFIDLLLNSIENKETYDKTFIASSKPLTLLELALTIKEYLGLKPKLFKVPLFLGQSLAYLFDFISIFYRRDFPFSMRRLNAMTKSKIYKSEALPRELSEKDSLTKEGLSITIDWFKKENLI